MANSKFKESIAKDLTLTFFTVCNFGFPLIGAAIVLGVASPFMVTSLTEKTLTAKLTFTSLGLLFGILQVFLGILVALIGIAIDYDLDAGLSTARLKIASTSPGILLILLGNALFAFALTRSFDVTEATLEPPHATFNEPKSEQILNVPELVVDGSGPE